MRIYTFGMRFIGIAVLVSSPLIANHFFQVTENSMVGGLMFLTLAATAICFLVWSNE